MRSDSGHPAGLVRLTPLDYADFCQYSPKHSCLSSHDRELLATEGVLLFVSWKSAVVRSLNDGLVNNAGSLGYLGMVFDAASDYGTSIG